MRSQRGRGRGGLPGGAGGSVRGRGDSGGLGRGTLSGARGRGDLGGGRGGGISYGNGLVGPGGYRGGPGVPPISPPRYIPHPDAAPGGPVQAIAPGVKGVGVPRPAASSTLGTPLTVTTNCFAVTIPETIFHHYDVGKLLRIINYCALLTASTEVQTDRIMPAKFNMDLIRVLQERIAPTVFTPRAAYDGRKNLFANHRLPLSNGDSQIFEVTLEPAREGARPPKIYRVALKRVAEINPILLSRYQQRQGSYDPMITTALAVFNVIARMEPIVQCPRNSRSFFTNQEMWAIGGGIELWRGYFQSVRPGTRSMLMNVDISTGTMFASGSMIGVCQSILGNSSPDALVPGQGLSDRERHKLKGFLSSLRFTTNHKDRNGQVGTKPKTLRTISSLGAVDYKFRLADGSETDVAQYFQSVGINLRFPRYVCIETSTGAAFPIELCNIIPGQLMRKQIPPDMIASVLSFSTKAPGRRLDSIVAARAALQYGQSEYMNGFRMVVGPEPERCLARVLPAPALNYGAGSKRKQLRPSSGSWNLVDQKFFKPATVTGWAVVVYDTRTVREPDVLNIIRNFKDQADSLGIKGLSHNPPISYPPAESLSVQNHLHAAGDAVYNTTKRAPSLIVIIMPNNSNDLYQAIKHFGDVKRGVPTQCLNAQKARRGDPQYFANVCLKVNAKLGGVNSTLDPQAQGFLSDSANPVMIIGSHVMHPAPGAVNRPSFAAVVGSTDSTTTQYSAVSSAQDSRVQMITELHNHIYELIGRHIYWKKKQEKKQNAAPKRIIYFRSGVSDGMFQHVLDIELPRVKEACARHNINPTITIIVVNRRHRIRFFPTHGQADRSGNCPAGTVVDDVVGKPIDFDFYLQGQGGMAGTSRSAHYSVLHDENNFTPDNLKALAFSLCHACARTTRSLSIPAPLHSCSTSFPDARIVSGRAKNHYDPSVDFSSTDDEATEASHGESSMMQRYRDHFQPVHQSMQYRMLYQIPQLPINVYTNRTSKNPASSSVDLVLALGDF
ncbi:argonaute-like protein [Ceratobasidium sp. AG-Ba]|nr:argonaute-like protein [Ceratobasidium sp. AG-Ba]